MRLAAILRSLLILALTVGSWAFVIYIASGGCRRH